MEAEKIQQQVNLISLSDFLKKFSNPNSASTFTEFLEKAEVISGKNAYPLKTYMKKKDISKQDIKMLFENIQNKNDYLTRFYTMSMRVQPENFHMSQFKPMKKNKMNNNEEVLFKNIIRNIHFKGILQETKSGIENNPTYMNMLNDLYKKNKIDYKILTPSAVFYMKEGRLGSVFSSYYFRASIMNPYLVYSLNESVLEGTKVFTPTLGWTSYCYGFMESPKITEYVGTDVIPSVCEKTRAFANLYPSKKCTIYCKPSEDLLKSKAFLTKYREHFDLVFFSPPYYRLELYEGEMQSTENYKTYEEWLEKYWDKTIQLCNHVLKKGGKLCYILSGYGSENTKEEYDLLGDMNKITKTYFTLKSIQPMFNKDVHVTKHKETDEKIMVFIK